MLYLTRRARLSQKLALGSIFFFRIQVKVQYQISAKNF